MTEQERNERILESRKLIQWNHADDYKSDQMLRREQPPLTKAAMRPEACRIDLPKNFDSLSFKQDVARIFFDRKSSRVYTEENISLEQFSFLCWVQQGVKGIRGKQYATLRTVPSGGARHPFEMYIAALHVDGLKSGLYHYLPMTHSVELLKEIDPSDEAARAEISETVCGQKWAVKASAIFYYSIIPYRGEWRYAFTSHRVMMMDAGHVTENLYLACSALDLGACAIGAANTELCDDLFELDGKEEYMFYCCPVGTISVDDEEAEKGFYAFLKTEEQYYHNN